MTKTDKTSNKSKTKNKRFLLISLIIMIITNVIIREPIVYTYEELIRYFRNGFQPRVLGFFFENLGMFLLFSGLVFFGSFAIMKGISLYMEQEAKKLKEAKEKSADVAKDFSITKNIDNFVAFDDESEKWAIYNNYGLIDRVFNYSDIVNFELLEDGNSVASGGVGRALVGGVLFGGIGAVVGGVTGKKKSKEVYESLKLKITIDDMSAPVVYIHFIEMATKQESEKFKEAAEKAQECLSYFQLICDKQEKGSSRNVSNSDEIMKYKELLDADAITKDEYEAKKKELLGL